MFIKRISKIENRTNERVPRQFNEGPFLQNLEHLGKLFLFSFWFGSIPVDINILIIKLRLWFELLNSKQNYCLNIQKWNQLFTSFIILIQHYLFTQYILPIIKTFPF